MLYYLHQLESFWGPFRLFEYLTVRAILAGFTALVIGMLLSSKIIKALSALRQPERSAQLMGNLAKEGGRVPTMGGLLIGAAMIPSVLLWARPNVLVLATLFTLGWNFCENKISGSGTRCFRRHWYCFTRCQLSYEPMRNLASDCI
jgi:hypothetical protein